MKISAYSAHVIRDGIMEAKLDLADGADCHDREPAVRAGSLMGALYMGNLGYSRLEESAYQHVMAHARQEVHPSSAARASFGARLAT